jgi:hypothetical protein
MNKRQVDRVGKAINKCRNEILAVVSTLTPMEKQQIASGRVATEERAPPSCSQTQSARVPAGSTPDAST